MKAKENSTNYMEKIAAFIIDKRNLFFLLYIFAMIFCLFSMNWTKVENDITTYLSEDSETRHGLEIMSENFAAFGSARIMVSNITYEKAEELYEQILVVDGVDMVEFDNTVEHYKETNALYSVNFKGTAMDVNAINALEKIQEILVDYNCYYDTTVGYDENAEL